MAELDGEPDELSPAEVNAGDKNFEAEAGCAACVYLLTYVVATAFGLNDPDTEPELVALGENPKSIANPTANAHSGYRMSQPLS